MDKPLSYASRKLNTAAKSLWDSLTAAVLVALMLMGVGVIVGWYMGWRTLVQILPGAPSMQYNTALCFLILGASTWVFITRHFHKRFFAIGGVFVFLLSAVSFVQYTTGMALGIDTLFFTPADVTTAAHPGRMTLPTTVGFLCAGGALVALWRHGQPTLAFAVAQMFVLGLGLTSLSAYLIGLTSLTLFGIEIQTAVHTAAGFVAYGGMMLAYAWRHSSSEAATLRRWGPALSAAAVLGFFVCFGVTSQTSSAPIKMAELALGLAAAGLSAFAIYRLTNFKIANKGFVLITIPLLFVLMFVALATRMKWENEEAQRLYLHSKEVIATAQALSANVANAQYILRAYVATNLPAMADPYYPLARQTPETAAKLQSLVADNPLQTTRAAALSETVAGRMEILSTVEQYMRAGNRAQAVEQMRNSYDRGVWAPFLQDMESFIAFEEQLDGERHKRVEQSWRRLNWLLVIGAMSAILLAFMLVRLFSHGVGARLRTLSENAESLARGESLAAPLTGTDEIAHLDQVFHRMAKTLAQASRKERAIIEYAQDFICSIDADGRFVKVNPASQRIFGYEPGELIGQHFQLLLPTGEAGAGLESLAAIKTRESVSGTEARCLRKDGQVVDTLWSASWSEEEQQIFCVARDISERKRTEEAVRLSEAKYAGILAIAADAIISVDESQRIVLFNGGAEKIFGYTRDEAMGQPLDMLIPTRYRTAHASHVHAFGESPGTARRMGERQELFALRKGGEEFPAEASISKLEINGERTFTVVLRDISERKRAEQSLKNYAAEMQDLYDQAPCGYHSLASDGTVIQINDTELEWLGYSREEVIGRLRFQDFLTPESHLVFQQSFPEFKERGWMHDQEFEMRRKDGSVRTVLMNATAIRDARGEYVSSRSTVFDISDRKRADLKIQHLNEALERHAAQVEAANKELESFSYSVSHDLRAPLRHIDGFVALLKRNSSTLDAKSQRYLQVISEAAKQMGRLIDDLLAFSRMGRVELQTTVVNLGQMVEEVRRDLRRDTEGRNVEWRVSPLPEVMADPEMLRLVLVNLMSNAVKYTRPRLDAVIEIGCRDEGADATVIFIRDNGVGFDMKYQDKLFGVFQRLHRADEFEGTGIGLANVRRIIHRHGGMTWAEGAVDSGATFYFSLPKAVPTTEDRCEEEGEMQTTAP